MPALSAIEEVVVTATRRETALQVTPMSLSVVGAQTLRQTRADDFADFAKLVPGLTFIDSGPGNKRYALRGLQSPGEPEVALYYDEIPISGIPGGSLDTGDSQPDLKLWDIERIEVLRGPQGTLYGNGSIGGAIRIISTRAQLNEFAGETQVIAGDSEGGDASYRVNQMLNLPLVPDRLALRIAAYGGRHGGWVDRRVRDDIALPQLARDDINDEKTWGGRVSMNLQATEAWNLTAIAYYQRLHTSAASDVYPDFATGGNPYISQAYVHTPWLDESRMYNVISNYDYAWGSFVATASYQHGHHPLPDAPVPVQRIRLGPDLLRPAADAGRVACVRRGRSVVRRNAAGIECRWPAAVDSRRRHPEQRHVSRRPGGYRRCRRLHRVRWQWRRARSHLCAPQRRHVRPVLVLRRRES
jgi:outer membrane receptor protein involved in Fe transport